MKKRNFGFTLVELLVVIGIIAVLISILLPALGRVRHQAQVTACAARMRDLTTTVIMYANENKGALPPYTSDNGQAGFKINMSTTWPGYREQFQLGEATNNMGNGFGLGRIYATGYLKTLKTVYCPSTQDPPDLSSTNTRNFTNYVFNPHLAYRDNVGTNAVLWWKKLPNYGKGAAGNMRVKVFGTEKNIDMPRFRRAILVDPLWAYGGADDLSAVTHAVGTKRAFNLAYPDGSVSTYTANSYLNRAIDRWDRALDISNAIQYANDGGAVDWKNYGSWQNKFNIVPIFAN